MGVNKSNQELNTKNLKTINNTDNGLPVSIYDLIKKVNDNILKIKDNPDFQIKSSGLIINTDGKGCKGYCIGDNEIPNICGKGINCKNFGRAQNILKKINDFENEQSLKNIY